MKYLCNLVTFKKTLYLQSTQFKEWSVPKSFLIPADLWSYDKAPSTQLSVQTPPRFVKLCLKSRTVPSVQHGKVIATYRSDSNFSWVCRKEINGFHLIRLLCVVSCNLLPNHRNGSLACQGWNSVTQTRDRKIRERNERYLKKTKTSADVFFGLLQLSEFQILNIFSSQCFFFFRK